MSNRLTCKRKYLLKASCTLYILLLENFQSKRQLQFSCCHFLFCFFILLKELIEIKIVILKVFSQYFFCLSFPVISSFLEAGIVLLTWQQPNQKKTKASMKYFEAYFYSLILFTYLNKPNWNTTKHMFAVLKTFTTNPFPFQKLTVKTFGNKITWKQQLFFMLNWNVYVELKRKEIKSLIHPRFYSAQLPTMSFMQIKEHLEKIA